MAYTAAYLVGTAPDARARARRLRARVVAPGPGVRDVGRAARAGRSGVAELVDRCCALARRFADQLAAVDGVEVVNDVVLNQVLVRFGDDDATTDRVIEAVQRSRRVLDGRDDLARPAAHAHLGVELATTEADVDRSVRAIAAAARP